jgi:ribosomal protein S18 acetylase RimI-like enzyme
VNNSLKISRLSAQDVIPLRTEILRPNAPPNTHTFPGDEADETYHAGVFFGGELVGVASVFREEPPFETLSPAWRLRGMAVMSHARRKGCGRALVYNCLDYLASQKAALLWCNGRSNALLFYRALGFQTYGEEFIVPISGPHYVMWRDVIGSGLKYET